MYIKLQVSPIRKKKLICWTLSLDHKAPNARATTMSLRSLKLQTLGLVICGSAVLLMLISFLGLPDDGTGVEYIHRPMLSTIKNTNYKEDSTCAHTNQGKYLVVDDKGTIYF